MPRTDFVAFNPSSLCEDAFLAGPQRYARYMQNPGGDLLDISDIFEKDLETILAECNVNGTGLLEGELCTASTLKHDYAFVHAEVGVVLFDPDGHIAGAYLGCDLAVDYRHRGQGLGAELVLEYAMRHGEIPPWWLDDASYTPAGVAAHRAAWRLSQNPELFARKVAEFRKGAAAPSVNLPTP